MGVIRKRLVAFIMMLLTIITVMPSTGLEVHAAFDIDLFAAWAQENVDGVNASQIKRVLISDMGSQITGIIGSGRPEPYNAFKQQIQKKMTESGSVAELEGYAALLQAVKVAQSTYGSQREAFNNIMGLNTSQGDIQNTNLTMDKAKEIVSQYVFNDSAAVLNNDVKLTAAAYNFCQIANTLKIKGWSEHMIKGVMCNMYAESHFDPYMIEGGKYYFEEYTTTGGGELVLKLNNDQNVFSDVTTLEQAGAKLIDEQRINFDVALAPTKGIGLIQFTDSNKSNPTYQDLLSGMRRSSAINAFNQLLKDPWTCVLKVPSYTYWMPPTDVTNVFEEVVYQEDGTATTIKTTTGLGTSWCRRSSATEKLPMANSEYQVAYMTDVDGPNCFQAINKDIKAGVISKLPEATAYLNWPSGASGFNQMKAFSGNGMGKATADKVAIALFTLYEERPSNAVDRALSRYRHGICEAVAQVLGYDGYAGIDISAISSGTVGGSTMITGDAINSGSLNESHLAAMAQSGYFTANELSSFAATYETNVQEELLALADKEYLTRKELYNLVAWEEQVATNSLENNIILMGRKITLWMGILMLVWAVLFYLAFWFDRVNTMFYIDAVGLMSFKKLQYTDNPEHSTYNLKKEELNNTNTKIVCHRDVIFISVFMLVLGTLFATGRVFSILQWVIMKVYNFLG